MGLFKPDLYRSFGIGFVIGALIVGASAVDSWSDTVAAPAQAAEMDVFEPVTPASEFIIESE